MRATPESYFRRAEHTHDNQTVVPLEDGYVEVIPPWVPWVVGISIVGAFAVAMFAIYYNRRK